MSTHLHMQGNKPSTPTFSSIPARASVLQRKRPSGRTASLAIEREHEEERQERSVLRRRAVNKSAPTVVPPIVHEVLHSPGQPLDPDTRALMESRFGHDFSRVRVHTDARAGESARAVNAMAYTSGHHIAFGTAQYTPGTDTGRRLLAHELTHVAQQKYSVGISRHTCAIGPVDDVYETEATQAAKLVADSSERVESNFTPAPPSMQRACGPNRVGAVSGCIPLTGDITDIAATSDQHYLFQVSCDDFIPGEEDRLKNFATTLSFSDVLEIHGFASEEGPAEFNDNLSCARAHKAESVLTDQGIGPSQIQALYKHGATPGPRIDRRSVVIDKLPSPTTPGPAGGFSHSAAAAYARTWALGTNPSYPRFTNDCTNFVSQAMLAGGWTMVGGSVFDRARDDVWWYGRSPFTRASYTWAGAQNFANFCRVSGRGTRVSNPMLLNPGDVLQMAHGGHIGHSMVVTGKTDTDLLLSYHTSDHLDEPYSAIRRRDPRAVFVPWRIS